MQHVSTYNSHLQAKLRTVIALQGGCERMSKNNTEKRKMEICEPKPHSPDHERPSEVMQRRHTHQTNHKTGETTQDTN
jgi:hypothetical protein